MLNAEVFKIEMDDIHQVAFPKSEHKNHVTSSFHNLPDILAGQISAILDLSALSLLAPTSELTYLTYKRQPRDR